VNLSVFLFWAAVLFAALALVPFDRQNPSRPWVAYFWPISWFCFVLAVALTHPINWHG
jgi:hypothetical protein